MILQDIVIESITKRYNIMIHLNYKPNEKLVSNILLLYIELSNQLI